MEKLRITGSIDLPCDGSAIVDGVRHEPGSSMAVALRDAAGGDAVLGGPRSPTPEDQKVRRRITKIDHKTRTVTYE